MKSIMNPLTLWAMFHHINLDCEAGAERSFEDEDYYAEQLMNIFNCTREEAESVAHQMNLIGQE